VLDDKESVSLSNAIWLPPGLYAGRREHRDLHRGGGRLALERITAWSLFGDEDA
jgi:hypothetical protein